VSIFERLGELAKAALTVDTQLHQQQELLAGIRQEVLRIDRDVQDLRNRVIRLEAYRDADRAQMDAEMARFKLEVERAYTRLSRLLPEGSIPLPRPESGSEGDA
jgi:hypothetical protein